MPQFRIHRIKDAPGENFRWAPHTGGLAVVKPKDYDVGKEVEAATPYTAWKLLADEGRALRPGDLLEVIDANGLPGELRIFKFVGFEPARWYVPEPKPDADASVSAAAIPAEPIL